MTTKVQIEIDGKPLSAPQGAMIIEAADTNNIYIPRFCYHKKLSIAANCRMCLVEVEKSKKPLPACATPVTDGMKVFTQSPKAIEAQKGVMEYLLINHPLDCPICDQGGECELQDLSMGYGRGMSLFTESKRSVHDDDLGPLIDSNMTRCIQCTRCVRFGQEVAGLRELGATGRGEDMEITTYVKRTLVSELSGNIIDLCPVGALTSKPFRFLARAWEMQQLPAIAPHDCVGSHISVHQRRQQVLRVVPREQEDINETWISDRDRFGYTGLYTERVTTPLIRNHGQLVPTDWPTALKQVTHSVQRLIEQHGAKQLAGLISPSATTEELYLWQALLRTLGCQNIDHRLHQTSFIDEALGHGYGHLPIPINELDTLQHIVLIGSNLTHEQPMLGNWVRKAAFNNAAVYSINPVDFDFHMPLAGRAIVQPHVLPHTLAALAKALTKEKGVMISTDQKAAWEQLVIPQAIALMASELAAPGSKLLLLGALALNHPEAAEMLSWIHLIATALGAPIGCLTEGANAQGAWLMGAVPYRDSTGRVTEPGMSWVEAIAKPRKGYWLFGIDPEEDCAMPATATRALQEADTLVAFSAHLSPWLQAHAEVILPIAPFTENAGTLINCEGRWQGFNACVKPLQDARPGWQVLCVLASLNRAPNLAYDTLPEIQEAIKTQLRQATAAESAKSQGLILPAAPRDQLIRIGYWPMYRVDALCRRAEPLQQVPVSYGALAATLNPATAARYHLRAGQLVNVQQGDAKLELPVLIDASIPDDCVLIPAGFAQTAVLDALFGEIELVST